MFSCRNNSLWEEGSEHMEKGKTFRERMLAIARIGRQEDGGISRVFGSDYYKEAAGKVLREMQELGMRAYIDPVGNVHGIQECGKKNAKEILIASHLDTVKEGGVYDGLLGLMAGIECVRRLQEENRELPYDLHVIATNGEEGNELGGTFGSRCLMGMAPTEDATYLELAGKYGFTREDLVNSIYDTSRCKAYLELHIEQGKTLDEENIQIGAVTGIVGLQRYKIKIHGISNHAGTTMMEYRQDALVELAQLIADADRWTREIGNRLVCTFSRIQVSPNVFAVINNEAEVILECRNQNVDTMAELIQKVQQRIGELPDASMEQIVRKEPVTCAPDIVDAVEASAGELGCTCIRMPSGATHDGNCFATKMPIGMIFVPSVGGLSHCKEEYTPWEDVDRGVEVLYQTLLKI